MPRIEQTYERITRYLKGLLSNRERHDLEKSVMQDAFDEEAFEGFNALRGEEFDADMDSMMKRLDSRTTRKEKSRYVGFYKIAAVLIILLGLGSVLYIMIKKPVPELITQEIPRENQTSPETRLPPAPFTKEQKQIPSSASGMENRSQQPAETIIPPPAKSKVVAFQKDTLIVSDQVIPESNVSAGIQQTIQALPDHLEASYDTAVKNYITGRVLGVNRQALAGVSIAEAGSRNGTISDLNGNFRIKVQHADSRLAFNYLGYKPVEMPTREVTGKEITLDEELIALNEVVVVGYGSSKRAKSESAAETKRAATSSKNSNQYVYQKPVPPGGTMEEFEKWVEARLDIQKLMEVLPGNYRIQANIHVLDDGSLGEITIKNDVPELVALEYKKAILLSPAWQPAKNGDQTVDAQIRIIFSLTVK